MLQIDDTIISFDLIEREFICDLNTCLGACCIEGDSGAPLIYEERDKIEELLPVIWDDLLPEAKKVIEETGVSYIDEEGDLVTNLIHGKDCVFTYYEGNGICKCVLEKAFREGKSDFYKPISCHLYPVRLKEYDGFTAVNVHRWKICKCAEVLGRREGVKLYQFLKEPLVRRFGEEWYEQLDIAAKALPDAE
ncbi:DUF3109 family protein [Parabacteroides sp. FAFU027]|uniref:DUF3109 family protein n=1 Tax=Parabacteroides sp. FAFU027 TaxID=2922715 RepID=UPI001FB02943|nr:DUF3109 family protein [Parabacteroides sp. FAFU027]